jgi:hypothetical protein
MIEEMNMVFDTLERRVGRANPLSPMQIARHTLFTAREKLDLLAQVKAQAMGALVEGDPVAFEPAEVDAAIAHVRDGVARGMGSETVLKGDYDG